jgi:hypothetical protein
MAKIKDCPFIFIAGVEGSGTSLILQLLDHVDGFTCLGGNYVSKNYELIGQSMNEITNQLWSLPRLPKDKRPLLIDQINDIDINRESILVYKRSYPFTNASSIPDLRDVTELGKNSRIILMRRHFFDNVNSILRRGFETDIDRALDRIALGYSHLYKQAFVLHNSGIPIHVIDYDRLTNNDSKKSELSDLSNFLGLKINELNQWSGMIVKPFKDKIFIQKSDHIPEC